MKLLKKLFIAISIVLLAAIAVPNIVPAFNSAISVQAASIKINATSKTMNVKETYTLKVSGTKKTVKWSTSKKSIASVSSKGKVNAKKAGTATITAKVGSKKIKCKIKVESPKLTKTYLTLQADNSFALKVKGTTQKVKWSSSKTSVAKVSSKGVVTAVKQGTATIIAKVGSTKYKCKVTVPEPNYASKIKLNYVDLGNKILVSVKNNNTRKIDYIGVDVNFYKNGKLLDTKFFNTVCLNKNSTSYELIYAPLDSNYDYLDFDDVKFNVSDANVYSKSLAYKTLKGYISINHNIGSSVGIGVVGTITNTGNTEVSFMQITAIYYKDGKIIGAGQHYDYDIKAGASKSFKITAPQDSNYNYIDFDSYKLNIDYAYGY